MEIALLLAAIILLHVSAICIQLWNASRHLFQHPHVLSLAKALPVQGALIQQLINDMANLEDIESPAVFIYRSQLPNAYIAAMPLRPELLISDEALEHANQSRNPVKDLAQLIGHELAHIKLHHGLYHAPVMYIARSASFWFIPLRRICNAILNKMEAEADQEGAKIVNQYLTTKAR